MSIFGSQRFLEERRSVTSPTFLNIFQSIIAYLVTVLLFSAGYVLRSCRRVFCPIRSFLFPHPPHLWNPAYTRTRTYMQTPSVDACPECLIRRFQKYLVGGAAAATAAATEPPPSLDCSSPPTSFTYFSSPAAPKSSRRVAKFCRLSSSCFENKKRYLSFFLSFRKKKKKENTFHAFGSSHRSTDGFKPRLRLIDSFSKEKRKRDRYDDDVRHSDCATIFGRFTHLSSGRGTERELERKGWDGWPARQLGVSGRCTPSLACQRGFDALRHPLTSFQRPDPASLAPSLSPPPTKSPN